MTIEQENNVEFLVRNDSSVYQYKAGYEEFKNHFYYKNC